MKWHKGQATRTGLLVLHQFGHVALLALLLVLVLFGLFGFRLSQGPIEIPHLASWFANHFTGEGVEFQVGKAELAWAGYHKGGEVPFVLKLADIKVRTQAGNLLAEVPEAVLSLPVEDLFGGRKPFTLDGRGGTLANTDAPVSWYANLWPGQGFTLLHSDVHVLIGAGTIGQGLEVVRLDHAGFTLSVLHDGSVMVSDGQLQLARQGQSTPKLKFSFAGRYNGDWEGLLDVQMDKLQAQDLPAIWPAGLMPETRLWVTTHVTAGSAQNGSLSLDLAAQGNLSHLHVTHLHGAFNIDDSSISWLNGAPPLTNLSGLFTIQDADNSLITATSGNIAGLKVLGGSMKLSDLTGDNPAGLLQMDLGGTVTDLLTILAARPFDLLDHAPDNVKKTTGTAHVSFTAAIPFQKNLNADDVALQVRASFADLRIPTPISGLAFTKGQMTLRANNHQLSATANAELAGTPVRLTFSQDLSEAEGIGRFEVEGKTSTALWQALGLDTSYISVKGAMPFALTVTHGAQTKPQQFSLDLDLTPADLTIPVMGWTKPAQSPGTLRADFTLRDQTLVGIQNFDMQATGLLILLQSTDNEFIIKQLQVGRTQLAGTLTRPAASSQPWTIHGEGDALDLRLDRLNGPKQLTNTPKAQTPATFFWQADLNVGTLYTASPPAAPFVDAKLTASGHGDQPVKADFLAKGVVGTITPRSDGDYDLRLNGNNAGTLLSALGIYNGVSGGTLDLKAIYGKGPIHGVLNLTDIRLVHAPGFIKVLQAATLYGLAEALSGPGLHLDHTTIPFTLDDNILNLHSADTYSEALGFTASGTINTDTNICDLQATIIPAYALNSFLGKIPLIGHLFTAEKGGGLFAMRAHLQGKINDPQVSVNPFSVFIPGFLRGVFGLGYPQTKH